MKMKLFVLFVMVFGSKESETVGKDGTVCGEFEEINAEKQIVVKIEEDEYVKMKIFSQYFGVLYINNISKWRVQRRSKHERKPVYNGHYDTEELAAHASDTLARKLMDNGEQNHKLNFPDDNTEVFMEKRYSSKYSGVSYHKGQSKWQVQRCSKNENKRVHYGYYDNEKKAAHASDTLARKLMEIGEKGHKLNFPDDNIEVHKKRFASKYIGVSYIKSNSKWRTQRFSKKENKPIHYGCYDTEELAAHASDTLARKLMENGEQDQKLNFPDDNTKVHQEHHRKKRKRLEDLENLKDN